MVKKHCGSEAAERWKGEKTWLGVLIAGMTLGAVAFGYISIFGHTHEFRIPWQPTWGLLVSSFEFLILCGAGLSLVAGIVYRAGGERFQALCISMTTLAAPGFVIGLGLMAIELTQPTRLSMASVLGPAFYRALLLDLTWFAMALGALFAQWSRVRRGQSAAAALLGAAVLLLAFGGIYQMGDVLRQFGHAPEWLSPPNFIGYLLAAMVNGVALASLVLFLNGKFGRPRPQGELRALSTRLRLWMIAALALYGAWLLVVAVGGAAGLMGRLHAGMPFLLTGPLAITFWGMQVSGGLLLPLLLLPLRRMAGENWTALLAGLVLAGQFFRSYNVIIASQLETFHVESSYLVNQGLLALRPCLPKTTVVIGAICLFLFLMTLAEKLASPDSAPSG